MVTPGSSHDGTGEKDRKRILVVDSSAGIGGGQKIAFGICSALKERYDFTIACPEGIYSEKYGGIGLMVEDIKGPLPIRRLRKIMRDMRPDIIHAHGTRAALWARISAACMGKKTRIVYTLHGLHISKRKGVSKTVLLILERILNRWTDVLVCVSQADKDEVLGYGLIDPKKAAVIKNGIDVDAFKADWESVGRLREKEGLKDKIVLTGIGRLHPQKDFSTLLKAVSILSKEGMDLVLLIAGDGPLRAALEEETELLGLKDRVRFLGFREDIPVIVNASDILVLSTNWEAFGLVCIEAGAAKKPVIASDVPGVREAVVNNQTGYLFRQGSAEDLAEKIRLLSGSETRRKLGLAGYEFVLGNYDVRRMVEEYGRLYEKTLHA